MSTKCSGDIDGRVPVTSTTYSLSLLKLPVKAPWRSWTVNDQVVSSSKTAPFIQISDKCFLANS